MFNHRQSILCLSLIVGLLIGLHLLTGLSLLWIGIPAVLFGANIIHGTFSIQRNYYLRSVNKGRAGFAEVALTFDDGPSEHTRRILDTLDKHKLKATFFVIGKNAVKYPDILIRAYEQGHLIGNHTFTHSAYIDLFGSRKFGGEIEAANIQITRIIGRKPRLFRPPYGVTNPAIRKAVKRTKMLSIGWSNRSLDTLGKPAQDVVARIMRKLKNGDVILLHDRLPHSPIILELLLKELAQRRYQVVPLEKLTNIEPYEED